MPTLPIMCLCTCNHITKVHSDLKYWNPPKPLDTMELEMLAAHHLNMTCKDAAVVS